MPLPNGFVYSKILSPKKMLIRIILLGEHYPNAQVCTKFREFSTTMASDIYVPGFSLLFLWDSVYNSGLRIITVPSDAGVNRPTILPVTEKCSTYSLTVVDGKCLTQVQPKH